MDLFAGKQKGLPTPALRFANHTNKNRLTLCVLCAGACPRCRLSGGFEKFALKRSGFL